MPSIERPLSGDVLVFRLDDEVALTEDPAASPRQGPRARTLLKDGPLRVTLIRLGPGGEIAEHSAEGPITLQALDGSIAFTVAGGRYDVGPGQLLSAAAGIRHAVSSEGGATLLLTVALPNRPLASGAAT
jgi:quercetin dioxygenase-like cupin family protein